MKLWIQKGIVTALMLASANSFAAHESYGNPDGSGHKPSPVGGPMRHQFVCGAPHSSAGMLDGVGYSATCQTAALPPQYSVLGCQLFSQVVYPGAPRREILLQPVAQDAQTAEFVSEDGIQLVLNKSDFTIQVQLSEDVSVDCVHQRDSE